MAAITVLNLSQAAMVIGVTHPNLIYWRKTDFLKPSSPDGYTFTDLLAGRVTVRLRRQGVSLQRLRKVVDYLRELGLDNGGKRHPLSKSLLVVSGKDIMLLDDAGLVSMLLQPGQRGVLGVADLKQEQAKTAELVELMQKAAV